MGTDANRTRLIHVGLGGWGGDWERNAIPPVAEVERVAIVDGHEPTLRAAQATLGLPDAMCFSTLAEAFAAVPADAVLVTAPMVAHVPLAIEALEAGKHVLVEKPFAATVAEATRAVELAEAKGLTLQVSQNYRFYPAPQAVRDLVRDGAVGDLSVVHVDFRKWDNDAPVETYRHYRFPHPLIYDMAIHHFDLLRMVTGRDAVKVHAQVTDPPWSNYVEEASAVLTIELEGGLVASYRGSWVSRAPQTTWAGEWSLEGRDGRITFASRGNDGPGDDVVEVTLAEQVPDASATAGSTTAASAAAGSAAATDPADGPEPVKLPTMDLWGRSAGLRQFAAAAQGGAAPDVTGRANLGSIALMEAAARSAASGRVEDVART